MSDADLRNPHTDALATLGSIIDVSARRDAIHLAVEPVIAGCDLRRAEKVGVRAGHAYPAHSIGYDDDYVGIVDPYLDEDDKGIAVRRGQRFWLVLRPRTIQSLRHVWSHPDFPDTEPEPLKATQAESILWVKEFAHEMGLSYNDLITAATGGEVHHDYLTIIGSDAHGEIPNEFWDHLQNALDIRISPNARAKWFSCSC